MPVIDFHTHIFPPELIDCREDYCARDQWFGRLYANPKARMASAEQLIVAMDDAGVELSVAFGFAFADVGLCRLGNDYVLEAAARYPDRLLPFILTNPAQGEAGVQLALDGLQEGGVGLGELMPAGQGFALTDFCLLGPLLELARAYGVPTMLHVNEPVGHAYPGKADQGPREAYEMASQYPENRFVLPHLGGGLPFYELMPEVRLALRNTYYDTAAALYLYEDRALEHILSWAPGKVLWGTDYPLLSQKRFLGRLRKAGLSQDALLRLIGGNASVLMGR